MDYYRATVLRAKNEYIEISKRVRMLGVADNAEEKWIELVGVHIESKEDLREYYDESSMDNIFFLIFRVK